MSFRQARARGAAGKLCRKARGEVPRRRSSAAAACPVRQATIPPALAESSRSAASGMSAPATRQKGAASPAPLRSRFAISFLRLLEVHVETTAIALHSDAHVDRHEQI